MKCERKDFFFDLCIIFIMFFYTLDGAKVQLPGIKALVVLGLACGMIKMMISFKLIVATKENLGSTMILLLVSSVVVFNYMRSADTRLPIALFLALCGLDVQPQKIIRLIFYTKLSAFLLVLCIGGYGHINGIALHGGMTILLYLCMREANLRKTDYVILFTSYLLLILYTKSGSAIVGIGAAFLSLFLIRISFFKKIYCSKLMICIYPIGLFFNSFLALGIRANQIPWIGCKLPSFVNETFMDIVIWIDVATSYRLSLATVSFDKFGVSWLGGNVDYRKLNPEVYFNLDSGMLWLLQGKGILVTIVIMILSIILMRYLIGTERYHYLIAALSIALWATQEDMLISVGTNFLMVLIGQAVGYSVKKKVNEKVSLHSKNLFRRIA